MHALKSLGKIVELGLVDALQRRRRHPIQLASEHLQRRVHLAQPHLSLRGRQTHNSLRESAWTRCDLGVGLVRTSIMAMLSPPRSEPAGRNCRQPKPAEILCLKTGDTCTRNCMCCFQERLLLIIPNHDSFPHP